MLYKIIPDSDYNGRVYLPEEFNNALKHPSPSFTKISAGLKECGIQAFTDAALNHDFIKISNDIINYLSIPQTLLYQIQCKEKIINLGPIIGLLMDKKMHLQKSILKNIYRIPFFAIHLAGCCMSLVLKG